MFSKHQITKTSHAQTYREVAARLREQADGSLSGMRADIQALAQQYDRMADSAEELAKPEIL
jgi:hypothetical protein